MTFPPANHPFQFLRRSAAVFGALFFMLAAPSLQAGGADGFYKPTSIEGSVRFAGRTYQLPLGALRRALLDKGVVPVRFNKIPVKRLAWAELVEEFEFRGIDGKATVIGPSNIFFTKRGKERYVGRAKTPLFVRQKGKYKFVPVTLVMRTYLRTVIKGEQLTMNSPIEIRVFGLTAKGSIRMEAKKLDIPMPPPGVELPDPR